MNYCECPRACVPTCLDHTYIYTLFTGYLYVTTIMNSRTSIHPHLYPYIVTCHCIQSLKFTQLLFIRMFFFLSVLNPVAPRRLRQFNRHFFLLLFRILLQNVNIYTVEKKSVRCKKYLRVKII